MSKREARRIAQWRTRAGRSRLRMTPTERERYDAGYANGFANGQIAALFGDERGDVDDAIDEALKPQEGDDRTADDCARMTGWQHGWHDAYAEAERQGRARDPELMATVAEQARLQDDPQYFPRIAFEEGFFDGAAWDSVKDDTSPEYVEPTENLPQDLGDAYALGFIAGYRAKHPGASDATARDAYYWRIYGHDAAGRLLTLEERDKAMAEELRKSGRL
jgi:hypothetical protein